MKDAKNKRLIVALIFAAILASGVFIFKRYWVRSFPYAGTIEATRVDLPARVATVVETIDVIEGQKVSKGQKLAELSCEDLKIAARYANDNYQRAVRLSRVEATSKEAFDQAQNRKLEADTRLSWCTIASPVEGTILDRYLEPKEWVNPGTKILAVADLQDVWAYIFVPMEEMSRLKVGQEVTGNIPELQNRQFKGVIRKINEEAEFTPKNVQTRSERTRLVFGVKIAFLNTDNLLKPGMTIEAELPE